MTDTVLHMERLIAAPRERVFRAFTQTAEFAAWWGPEGFVVPDIALDVRPGGTWRTVMKAPDGTLHTVGGVYRVIEPPARLVFTWAWETAESVAPGTPTEVSLHFDAVPGGTLLRLVHTGFPAAEARDHHAKGWGSCFDCLAKHVLQEAAA